MIDLLSALWVIADGIEATFDLCNLMTNSKTQAETGKSAIV
jgi:hypothetical protein